MQGNRRDVIFQLLREGVVAQFESEGNLTERDSNAGIYFLMGEEDVTTPDPAQIADLNKQSMERVKSFVDDLRIVEEHEKNVLDITPGK